MISKIRRGAYRLGRLLGDVQAARKGPIGIVKREERRFVWRTFSRLFRRLFR